MTMTAIGRTISFVVVGVLLGLFVTVLFRAAPAEARCESSKCATNKTSTENKPASSSKSSKATVRVAQRSNRKHFHRIASRHKQDNEKKTVVASADAKLPVTVANARAEVPPADTASGATTSGKAAIIAASNEGTVTETAASIVVVNPDELNEIDRAAVQGKAFPAAFINAHAEMREDQSSPWGQTSLIGKAFIVIGVMLTLASAARMLVA